MANSRYAGRLAAAVLWMAASAAASGADPGSVPNDDPFASHQVFYDQYWEQKLGEALAHIPGVVVKVTVDVNPELSQKVSRRQPIGTPVTVEERESEATKRTVPTDQPKKGKKSDPPQLEESRREAYSRTEPYESTLKGRTAGLTPRSANAVVVIPSSYQPASHEPTRTRTLADVQRIAETLLPYDNRAPRVTVVVAAGGDKNRRRSADVSAGPPLDPGPAPLRRGDIITVRLSDDELLAARVVSVLDDGTLVLQSRREQRVDGATWVTELSGQVRPEQVRPDRQVSAEQISELRKHTVRARARRPRDH